MSERWGEDELNETLDVLNDPATMAALREARDQVARGEVE